MNVLLYFSAQSPSLRNLPSDPLTRKWGPPLAGIIFFMHGRLNEEGVRPDQLLFALKNKKTVMDARRIDMCLLCRRRGVNLAGLCDVCYGTLNGEVLNQVLRWMSGQGP